MNIQLSNHVEQEYQELKNQFGKNVIDTMFFNVFQYYDIRKEQSFETIKSFFKA